MPAQNESIVAIATGGGSSALGVIRVSGTQALPIVSKIFHPVKPGLSLEKLKGYNLLFGKILDKQELIDEVLVSVFRAPKSFTGEDLVEISCHGSPFILQRVLQLCLKNGARLASPGEFTLRAYLNKKMDLSQAEAVADLISAKNEAAHKLAMRQMKGSISNEIGTLREELLQLSSLLELELDFSEEDVEFADRSQLKNLAEELVARCGKLLQSFRLGNALKKGIPVAIVGAPNAGKSTLLNTLLKENRALVSDIAGTTRDTIEEELSMDGIGFRIIDTAGIRETTDQVETLGIERTFLKLGEAQFILWIVDVSSPMNEDEFKKMTIIFLALSSVSFVIHVFMTSQFYFIWMAF
ncbi:MAG: tRNA uridine-5-carboxymethylaminomethyl(34) synthesis GTPase MnmE, partial [Luteibaculum sp.]